MRILVKMIGLVGLLGLFFSVTNVTPLTTLAASSAPLSRRFDKFKDQQRRMPNTRERWRNFGDVLILPVEYSIGSAAITSAT
jgi:hypothetical protein